MIDAVLLDLGNVLVFHDDRLLFRRLGERAGMREEEASRRIPEELRSAMRSGALDEGGVRAEVNRVLGTQLGPDEFFELFNSHLTVHDEVLPLVAALEALRAEPSRTLFFDDIEAYVEGARALGIRAEVFTTAPSFAKTLQDLGVI